MDFLTGLFWVVGIFLVIYTIGFVISRILHVFGADPAEYDSIWSVDDNMLVGVISIVALRLIIAGIGWVIRHFN
jgi:hypothetical protein